MPVLTLIGTFLTLADYSISLCFGNQCARFQYIVCQDTSPEYLFSGDTLK